MTKAEIIAIGDEILIGQVINSNAPWIATNLNTNGISVQRFITISDNKQAIINALDDSLSKADVVFITGGLGPTKDDITKHTLCEYFDTSLILNEERLSILKEYFESRGRKMNPINEDQAMVPRDCVLINNEVGTACGMWFQDKNGKIVISMPGVPFEMKKMMLDAIIPKIKQEILQTPIKHRTVRTFGIGESDIASIIEDWETNLPSHIKLAYLPKIGMVRLRLSGSHIDENFLDTSIDEEIDKLYQLIPEYIYGEEDDELETVVAGILKEKNYTIATAESCTGGFIAHRLTSIPGSSSYFEGSVISYSNEIKINELDVPASIIASHGAVSEEVVTAMAKNIQAKYNTDVSIACSGIAGPGGGTEEKPVGTIWIAVTVKDRLITKQLSLSKQRDKNILLTCLYSLDLLRRELL